MGITTRRISPRRTKSTRPNSSLPVLASARLAIVVLTVALALLAQSSNPEPPGWFSGDLHVHCDCGVAGGLTVTPEQVFAAMSTNRLAVVSLLADMGNGEVRDAARDLPKINGEDLPLSTPRQILHWDAEWHFDPEGVTFEQ